AGAVRPVPRRRRALPPGPHPASTAVRSAAGRRRDAGPGDRAAVGAARRTQSRGRPGARPRGRRLPAPLPGRVPAAGTARQAGAAGVAAIAGADELAARAAGVKSDSWRYVTPLDPGLEDSPGAL